MLAPTRELAAQISESIRVYGANKKLRSRVVFGGVGEQPQINGLRAGCDILVATPGRLLDLANRGFANLSEVRHLVLDEADRMLDMGFIHDIRRIIKLLPAKRQNLMFSATYTPDIRSLASRILVNPVQVEVTPPNSTVERVTQLAFRVRKDDKRHLLVHLFENGANGEGAGTRRSSSRAPSTARTACRSSSSMPASARRPSTATRARPRARARSRISRRASSTALVATEVASRGLDIRELPQVVNFDLPNVPEDYVHRIGRTARAGNDGHAVSLVSEDESGLLRDIERTMRQSVPFSPTPSFVRKEQAPVPQRAAPAAPARHAARNTRRFQPRRSAS